MHRVLDQLNRYRRPLLLASYNFRAQLFVLVNRLHDDWRPINLQYHETLISGGLGTACTHRHHLLIHLRDSQRAEQAKVQDA